METALILVIVVAASSLTKVRALPTGAPLGACDNLTPSPTNHGAQPRGTLSPYFIELSPLNGGYTSGQTYELSLSGINGVTFRGFLIQSRTTADGSPVGTFASGQSPDVQLSACNPPNIGVTHTGNSDKMSVSFQWTAPPEGTGTIEFRYAVVQTTPVFWADLTSSSVQELVVELATTVAGTDVKTIGASLSTTPLPSPTPPPLPPLLEDLDIQLVPANNTMIRGLPTSFYCRIKDTTGTVSPIPTQWYVNGFLYNEIIGPHQLLVAPEGSETNLTVISSFDQTLNIACRSSFYPGLDLASFRIDNPPVSIRFDQTSINASEGNYAAVCVSAFFTNEFFLEGQIMVLVSAVQGTADASDYSGILPSLAFDFGSEMFCFRLFISNDSVTEGEESFTLEIALDPANGNSVNAFIPPEMSRAVINIRETCYNGEIRLRGGYDENQGRVEICYDGVWGTVCDDIAWIEGMNAQVVCRQLGLSIGPRSNAIGLTGAIFGPGSYTIPIHLDNVNCQESATSLLNCTHDPIGQHGCFHTEDVSVDCLGRDIVGRPCSTTGEVQLIGGVDQFQGRVEVCTNAGVYSTVCDRDWDLADAQVVCRQLGFDGPAIAATGAVFGMGVGTTQITNVNCVGNEVGLLNCSRGVGSCSHFQDAGVECQGRPLPPGPVITFIGNQFFVREGESVELCVQLESGNVPFEFRVVAAINYSPVITNPTQEIEIISLLDSSVESAFVLLFLGPSNPRSCFTIIAIDDQLPEDIHKPLSVQLLPLEEGQYSLGSIPSVSLTIIDDDFLCGEGETRCVEAQSGFCVQRSQVCDGLSRCSDGSDEANCPDYCVGIEGGFNCLSESTCILESFVCDGVPDCVVQSFALDELLECNVGCTHGNVNLLGGPSASEGTVEVCINGVYYPVSLDDGRFTVREASVICRQLGQGNAGLPLPANEGNAIQSFRQAQVSCSGSEVTISSCSLSTPQFLDAEQSTARVRCFQQEEPVSCENGAIRLSTTSNEGRVEICYENVWGSIVGAWSQFDAAVACSQLGFDRYGAIPMTRVIFSSTNFLPVSLSGLNCVGNETSLTDCPGRPSPDSFGQPNPDSSGQPNPDSSTSMPRLGETGMYQNDRDPPVGVRCEDYPTSGCTFLDVRLIYRSAESTGILEVCNEFGQWNLACGEGGVSPDDASVVCSQLGYRDTILSPYISIDSLNPSLNNGSRQGSFLFGARALGCRGNESRLSECPMEPVGPTPTPPGLRRKRIVSPDPVILCSSVVRIGCNTSPRVTFTPPTLTGTYEVEVGREIDLRCSFDENVFQHPMTFMSSRLSQQVKRGISPRVSSNIQVLVSFDISPLDEDIYICSGSYGAQQSFEERADVTVRERSGLNESTYIRISAIPFDRLSSAGEVSIDDISRLVFGMIPEEVGGVHDVQCQFVTKSEFAELRGLDRIECNVTQYSNEGEMVMDVTEVVQRAALLLPRAVTLFVNPIDVSATGFCDAEIVESTSGTLFVWPEVLGGEEVSFYCPLSPNTSVSRSCGVGGVWEYFDDTVCGIVLGGLNLLNDSFANLTVETYGEAVETLSQVVVQTENNDIEQNTVVLSTVADYFSELATFVNNSNVTINLTVVEDVVQVVSSLLQWNPTNVEVDSSSSVLESFETVVSMYAQQLPLNTDQTIDMPSLTLVAELRTVESLAETGRSFTIGDNEPAVLAPGGQVMSDLLAPQQDAAINLPASLFGRITDRPNVGVFFALYNRTVLFPPSGRTEVVNGVATQSEVGSLVLAATVGPGLNFQNLEKPVTIVLRIQTPEDSFVADSEQCVTWNFTTRSWSTEGCVRVTPDGTADGIITCECNHLTNFAVLVDICLRQEDCGRSKVDEALTFISYIGMTISIVALVITIITLLLFKKLRQKDASKYHIQLSLAILLMLIVAFVVVVFSATDATPLYGGCVTMSVLVHYFTLVAVLLMGAEALLMFQKLVLVFSRVTTKLLVSVSIVCWTVPAVPVLIPLIVDLAGGHDIATDIVVRRAANEGDISFCFLSHEGAFWGAFLALIFLVLIFNTVIFIWVIVILVRHTKGTAARKKETVSNKTIIRLMISIGGVMSLFGLTWLFAILTISVTGLRETFQILFTVFNSFQGFFIFLFFCVFNKEALESWKEFLSCGKYRSKMLHPSHAKYSSGTGTAARKAKQGATGSTGFGTSTGGKHVYASEIPSSNYESSTLAKQKEFESEVDVETTPLKSKEDLSSPERVEADSTNQENGEPREGDKQKKKKTLSLKTRLKRYSTKKTSKHHVEEVEVDFKSGAGGSGSSSEEEATDTV